MTTKIYLVSLGCAKNLVDSENMLGLLSQANFDIVYEPEDADIIIVNTCAFIESAKEEAINNILEMASYKKDNCNKLIVTGCMVERYRESLQEELPEVDLWLGVNEWQNIVQFIEQGYEKPVESLTLYNSQTPRVLSTPEHMAYIKIAEGCDNACSYCVIPRIRGAYRSREFDDIILEAKELARRGVKEIVLIAQDTTRYGEDLYNKLRLAELLAELNKIDTIKWIRVMYAYPQYLTEELIQAFKIYDKVCPYIDLPLQHINDEILSNMNRHDTKKSIKSLLNRLREEIPNVCLRTSLIVGFPGETSEQFQELVDFVAETRFDRLGVFQYSAEEDTYAATMPNQVPDEIKIERYHELMSLQAKISEDLNKELEDQEMEIVIEGDEDGTFFGRSTRDALDIDGLVFVENTTDLTIGDFIKVRVLQGFTYEVVAEKI